MSIAREAARFLGRLGVRAAGAAIDSVLRDVDDISEGVGKKVKRARRRIAEIPREEWVGDEGENEDV